MPLKTAHSSVFSNVSLSLLFSQTHHLILSRLYLAIGGLSLTPLYPLIPPSSRTILLSSCTLTVSDYIQSTICKTSSVFCFVSSFLSAFCKFQPESWKEKKKKKASRLQPSIGYSPFARRGSAFVAFSFLPRFRLLSALALALASLQSRKQQVVPFISFLLSFLLSFCFVSPLYALQSRTFCVCYVDSFPLDPMDFVSVLLSEFCPVNLDSCQL